MTVQKVFSRFVATRKIDGAKYKFRVQEGTLDDKNVVMEFMAKYMTPTETFSKAAGMAKNKDALEEMARLCGTWYEASHTMICYEDTESNMENPVVGLSMVALDEGDNEDNLPKLISTLKTPEVKKMFEIVRVAKDQFNIRNNLGLDKYYSGRGVCIRPEYAGLGIATELFKLRRELCKEHGVPATIAWMTAIGSQKAAERDGWKTIHEISFEELGRLAEVEFYGVPPMCKLMVAFSEK